MSNANHYPDFYQPYEARRVPAGEQLTEAAQVFSELFDDTMLQNMGSVKRFESIKGRPTADLLQRVEVDGQRYTVALHDKSLRATEGTASSSVEWRDSETILRDISLQRIDGGYGREYWDYRLGADGIVRRWDGGDFTAKRQKERELGIESPRMLSGDEPIEEIGKLLLANMNDLINNAIPNGRLAEDLGVNNQPVTPDELAGLGQFLGRARKVE